MAVMNLRDIDDDLFRRFKAQSALDGISMKDKVQRLMELELEKRILCQPIDSKEKK